MQSRMRVSLLVAACLLVPSTINQASAQQIEFQIRTPSLDDDYLTWAPAPARIRQISTPQAVDRRVVLTNDPEHPVPAGRTHPLDGNVAFARSVGVGATATSETLELVLPKTGAWVEFVVAGSFPRASTEDKDAIIEVHEESAAGPVIHRHAAMVRIRKDHRDLTDRERDRFLKALSRLHREKKGYERFVRIHELASMGKYQEAPNYWWPDLAHRGSAFLAWHRAYLLRFERELQKIDATVALPYWRMDLLTSVFEENFVGANIVSTDAFVEPTFAADNPLAHWVVSGGALYRFPVARGDEQDLKARFFSDDRLFGQHSYGPFSRQMEGNPHNLGHNWTGPWMQNCMISPSDPVFWPFHTGFDRQWAKWQWLEGRIQPDGSNASYSPNDAYDDNAPGCNVANPTACQPIGHHLKDTMWPWNSKVGPGASMKGNRPPADLSQDYIGPFPKASIEGLWPAQPAVPTPADVIDFAGATTQRLDMGFAYDDVPFGVKPAPPPVPGMSPLVADARSIGDYAETAMTVAVAVDQNKPEAQRIEAMRSLGPLQDGAVAGAAIRVLEEAGRSVALGAAALEALSLQMMFGELDQTTHHVVMAALHKALSDKDLAIKQSALRILASHRDPMLIAKLAASLAGSADTSVAPVDAIRGLAVAGAARQYATTIRGHIARGDSKVRAAAIVALASDPESRSAITGILADANQPEEVRSAAIRSLAAAGPETIPVLVNVLKNPAERQALRDQAASALAATAENSGAALSKWQLDGIATELRNIGSSGGAATDRALRAIDSLRETK